MGCVNSKPDINDQHPNIFQVTNVNDQGKSISSGQLEVTETELVLYQRNKQPTVWPLKSLRKYGFDSGIFSFECGRRCPTGEGIYAFHCRKAEQLFNIVQHHIVVRNSNDDNNPLNALSPNSGGGSNTITTGTATTIISTVGGGGGGAVVNPNTEFPMPTISTGPPVMQRRVSSNQPEGYLNPVTVPVSVVRTHPSLSRPGSITSNGPVSPTATSPPPILMESALEHNNNKRGSLITDHQYTNTSVLNDIDTITQASYVNLGAVASPTSIVPLEGYVNTNDSPCHLYMNVDTSAIIGTNQQATSQQPIIQGNQTNQINVVNQTKDLVVINDINKDSEDEPKHCYANIDTKELEHLRPLLLQQNKINIDNTSSIVTTTQQLQSVPQTPTALYITVHEVNYAELDLDPIKSEQVPSTSHQLTATPDSPNGGSGTGGGANAAGGNSKSNNKKSYATIDFQKTNALSQSINPRMEVEDEGSRKTRHNSTISDVTNAIAARHSNSLSD